MGWLLPVTLGCVSFLSLLLPGTLSRRPGPHPLLARPREPPDRLSPQALESQAVRNVEPVALVGQPGSHLEPPVGRRPRRLAHPRHRRGKLQSLGGRSKGRGRGRRHTRRHHAQLMRMGCVLSTCQVQNLSHRLRQLMGQSGRQDSAPMNPKSPHSYG